MMTSPIIIALRYSRGVFFLVVPGCALLPVLSFARFSRRERIALALALGPVVVGLGMAGLRGIGLATRPASLVLAGLSLLALPLAARELRDGLTGKRPRITWTAVVVVTLPFLWIAAFWVGVPGFRAFNFHALM